MTSWQKRLRVGVAIFGIVFAGLVYRSIGERRIAAPTRPIDRLDPKAMLETGKGTARQVRGIEQEFEIKFGRTLTYEDGSAKHFDVVITVNQAEGRVFVVSAKEAFAGPNQVALQLSGGVKVAVNDGFELLTDHGTFDQNQGIARVPGEMTFKKGHMSGSGLNATYNQKSDVLNIAERAKVVVTDEAGKITLDGTAGSATLDRMQDILSMESSVHVLRGTQVINAEKVMARLSANEDVVTHLELRGNSSVRGGDGALQAMKADAIDLDYTDDGTIIQRAILNGSASLSTAADEQTSERHMRGGGLDVLLTPTGSVASVAGRDGVQLDLPQSDGAPSRSIRARTLDASSEGGRGLDALRFRDDVVFQEGTAGREVRAQSLSAALEGDGITTAFFTGGVSFKEKGLQAGAPEARYEPGKNVVSLSGSGRPLPYVTDDQIHVEARGIDLTLESHGMVARGDVSTTISGRTSKGKDGAEGGLPRLLKEGQPASVNAERLDYSGTNGRAEYGGKATLIQGSDTSIRGDQIVLDQQNGDLVASGSARSTLNLDSGRTDGRADEIQYNDASRTVAYSSAAVAPTSGQTPNAPLAQVSGPDGDLRAERIEVVLSSGENAVDRLEAHNRVTLVLGARTASGGRLTYHAKEQRYVMSSSGVTPVSLREKCSETTGRTLTFFKSTDRIIVDGDETRRTETRPCSTPGTPQPSPVTR